ncbi:MAG: hypothetical protein ACOX87_06885 [Chloroflexota bacterium]|jgi:hypothetical protein
MILPLMAAILSASAVLDDPAIELQLAAPRRPWRIFLERLALLLCIVAVGAFSYQLFLAAVGVEIDYPHGLAVLQLAWLVPSLALMGFSSLVAMGFAAATPATLLVGIVWIMQALIGGHFANNDWARYLYLFMAARRPEHPHLPANLLCLAILGCLFLLLAARLLEREEPYL